MLYVKIGYEGECDICVIAVNEENDRDGEAMSSKNKIQREQKLS